MPGDKGTYGSQVGRPKKMMYGGKVKKMEAGGKLKMVDRNGQSVPFYAADGVGKMMYGGKVKKMAMGGKASCPMKMRGGGVIEEIKESITASNPQMTDRLARMAGMRPEAPVKLGMRGQKPQKDIV